MRRAGLTFVTAACLWHAATFCLAGKQAEAVVGGDLAEMERNVAQAPGDRELRLRLAEAYERRGLLEEAVEQYVEVLARRPGDEAARGRIQALIAERMPRWLPGGAEKVATFRCAALELELEQMGQETRSLRLRSGQACPTQDNREGTVKYRLRVTNEGFAAREEERWDEVHERTLPRIDYGYVWEAGRKRWVMRVKAHWAEPDDVQLAQQALRATLAFYCVAKERLGLDPTAPWGDPVDVWLGNRGRPGARAVGRNMYLYSVKTARAPAEWVRQVAHEYGHIALPGIGGFTETDDPWADGHLGELLFPKWLAESGVPEWMPWSVEEWEKHARVRREELIARWLATAREAGWQEQAHFGFAQRRPAEQGSGGADEAARDRFLGLALRVEDEMGPRFLGDALRRCPRGTAAGFAAAVERLAREQGVKIWEAAASDQAGAP